jgi:hypothetical protein
LAPVLSLFSANLELQAAALWTIATRSLAV